LEAVLEESFSSSDPQSSADGVRLVNQLERRACCKNGCPAILSELAKTCESVGIHTGKTAQYRKSNYPNPKKGNVPRNVNG